MTTGLADPYFFCGIAPRSADIALYLDFDGVLHHEAVYWQRRRGAYVSQSEAPGHTLFEWANVLEEVLAGFPDVRLVLSSTWCVQPGYGKALARLSPILQARFIGGTFHKRHHGADPWLVQAFRATPRWRQIAADVERRQPRAWLALDDDTEDWPCELLSNLVACDGTTGLSSSLVREELRQKLLAASSPWEESSG